jgi:hypothetical protein
MQQKRETTFGSRPTTTDAVIVAFSTIGVVVGRRRIAGRYGLNGGIGQYSGSTNRQTKICLTNVEGIYY